MNIKEILREDGFIVCPNKGVSMMPLLRQDRDLMEIVRRDEERLHKYDAVLFLRDNGDYVMHRIVKVLPEGYIICGDNSYQMERVREDQILGVLVGVVRDGRTIKTDTPSQKLYARAITAAYPLRVVLLRARGALSKAKRFVLGAARR